MQLPVVPPAFDTLLNATIAQSPALLTRLMRSVSEVDGQGRYLHWDKLRHLPAPDGLTSEQWWLGIKLARHKNFKSLPVARSQWRCIPVQPAGHSAQGTALAGSQRIRLHPGRVGNCQPANPVTPT